MSKQGQPRQAPFGKEGLDLGEQSDSPGIEPLFPQRKTEAQYFLIFLMKYEQLFSKASPGGVFQIAGLTTHIPSFFFFFLFFQLPTLLTLVVLNPDCLLESRGTILLFYFILPF